MRLGAAILTLLAACGGGTTSSSSLDYRGTYVGRLGPATYFRMELDQDGGTITGTALGDLGGLYVTGRAVGESLSLFADLPSPTHTKDRRLIVELTIEDGTRLPPGLVGTFVILRRLIDGSEEIEDQGVAWFNR